MYYVWETRARRPTDVIVPKFPPVKSMYGVSFIAGRRFANPLPQLEFCFAADPPFTLTDDLIIRKRRCLVHSQRLADTLRRAGVDSIDYHPCRVVNHKTGFLDDSSYAVANLLDVVFCLDREGSELEIDDEEPSEIWAIERMKLLEGRLGASPMFRLGERPSTVLVHEAIKVAVERAGLTGPVFLPADGYQEYGGMQADNPVNLVGTHALDPDGEAGWWIKDEDGPGNDGPGTTDP